MFGDFLKNHINWLSCASEKKVGNEAFWEILKKIAIQDILSIYPDSIDSDIAVPIYYKILKENSALLPYYFSQKLNSNNQERFRVINRNLWTSNAFHPDGLANQEEIEAYKTTNESKKGERIVFRGKEAYVNK